jgi:hypothetical protein
VASHEQQPGQGNTRLPVVQSRVPLITQGSSTKLSSTSCDLDGDKKVWPQ